MSSRKRANETNMNHFSLAAMKLFLVVAVAAASILAPSRTANARPAGDPQNGKKVYEKLGCFRCHGSAGEGMSQAGKESGSPKIASTHLSLQEFVRSIRAPKGQMPPFSPKQVTDPELSDVYAFLQSAASQPKLELPSSANSQNGQHLYSAFGCYECHGLQGQGSVQTGGTRLGPPQTPFSGFVAYVRQPTGQMPPYTSKAISDAQLADIYAFLQSLPQAVPSKTIPLLNQ
jgi:ubiquinol-cytochrome c reductase cytochrome c subunit